MRKSKIRYNPSLTVKENAKKNGVSVAAIRNYIKVNRIDRRADRLMNLVENCRAYLKKHPNATKAEIHKETGHSVSAITVHWEYITTDKEPERKDCQFESCFVHSNGKELASSILNESHDILQFADRLDVSDFRKWLLLNQHLPMIVIGNGGKHTSYPALMYEMMSGIARTITPLEFASMSPATIKGCKILLLSSGGRNQDIVFATQRALSCAVPENIACLTFTDDETNKVVKTLKGRNTFIYKNPYIDGFIAIRSKILTYAILYKAFSGRNILAESIKQERIYKYQINGRGVLPHPKNIKHFCVLYSSYGEPVAHDIESTMTESGIASVQICDYRNYCHGRFIFGSNHTQETCMVMLITPREREIAKRIRKTVLPSDIPVIEITTERNDALATIELLLDSLYFIFDIAERYHGINPNSPSNLSGIDKRFPISGVKFEAELKKNGELQLFLKEQE